MMCHYPDLVSTSDWSCHKDNVFQPIKSHTHIWLVTCHQYRSFCAHFSFSGHFAQKPVIASHKSQLFSQA